MTKLDFYFCFSKTQPRRCFPEASCALHFLTVYQAISAVITSDHELQWFEQHKCISWQFRRAGVRHGLMGLNESRCGQGHLVAWGVALPASPGSLASYLLDSQPLLTLKVSHIPIPIPIAPIAADLCLQGLVWLHWARWDPQGHLPPQRRNLCHACLWPLSVSVTKPLVWEIRKWAWVGATRRHWTWPATYLAPRLWSWLVLSHLRP